MIGNTHKKSEICGLLLYMYSVYDKLPVDVVSALYLNATSPGARCSSAHEAHFSRGLSGLSAVVEVIERAMTAVH